MTDYGFERLGLNRLYLYVFASNTRAIASYRKADFREEARLREHYRRKDGSFADILMMGLLRSEWQERRAESQSRSGR